LTIKSTSHTTHCIHPSSVSVLTRIHLRTNTVCKRYSILNCAFLTCVSATSLAPAPALLGTSRT